MIYLTGDMHGDIDIKKLSNKNWPVAKTLTSDDYVIICGDFGFPFLPGDFSITEPETKIEKSSRATYEHWMKWLSRRKFTILWVDGNHENHPFWYAQPVVEWHGGKVNIHPKAPNVIHLKRGEYYEIDGYTFWTMGGAMSHDKMYRTPEFSWWYEEVPDYIEMDYGLKNLEAHNNKVDFIVTHTLPANLQNVVCRRIYDPEPTSVYFNEIYKRIDFKYWFCGHYHEDTDSRENKIRVFYYDIDEITNYI